MNGQIWLGILPMILFSVGSFLKGKDADETGKDDFIGSLLLAVGEVIQAYITNNTVALDKATKKLDSVVKKK